MLKALFCKQLQEMGSFLLRNGKTGKPRSKRAMIGCGLLLSLLLLYVMFSFGVMAWPLCRVLMAAGQSWLYFVSMGVTALSVSTLASAFMSYSALFRAKDNELLLSLPIPPRAILFVRLSSVYLTSLVYLLLAWLPTEIIYAIEAPDPLGALAGAVPMALLLSALATMLSALVGWAVAAVNRRSHNKTLVTVVLSLAFVGGYYLVFRRMMSGIEILTANAAGLGDAVRQRASLLFWLGRAAMGDVLALTAFAALVLAVSALFCFLLSRIYFSMMAENRSASKTTFQRTSLRKLSVRRALLQREAQHLASSANYLLNCSLGSLMLMGVGAYALLRAEKLCSLLVGVPSHLQPALLCAVVCLMQCTVLLTAPSVSLEGKNLWLMQSLPVTPWQALRAKLELHILLSALPGEFCLFCILLAYGPTLGEGVLSAVIVLLFSLFSAAFGLMLGLSMPNLHWTNEAVVIKQSAFIILSMFGSMGMVLLLGGWYLLWLNVQNDLAAFAACAIFLAGTDAALLVWLRRRGTKVFAALH